MTTMRLGGREIFTLPEGMTLIISGSADAIGNAYLLDPALGGVNASQSFSLTSSTQTFGPYIGEKQFLVTCVYGVLTITKILAITGVAASFADNETPSGANPGSVFTLANSPSPAASLILIRNGVAQVQGVDYTISGNTITYTTPMASGDTHAAWYRY